jgi:tRNA(Ile)-lysidine synthase
MLKLLFPLPRQLTVAFSGGLDSVAVADFLSRKHDIACAFFHHRTDNCDRAEEFVTRFCSERKIPIHLGKISIVPKPKQMSIEEYWRIERYQFLSTFGPVVTAHHLNDCVETYIWGSMHGTPKVIPTVRDNVLRPFLTTPKAEFSKWCRQHNLEWCEDASNRNIQYTRNYIRHEMMPHVLKVNPGIDTMVKKIVEKQV